MAGKVEDTFNLLGHAARKIVELGAKLLDNKEHIATDIDAELILSCAVTPANRPEEEATLPLSDDLHKLGVKVGGLSCNASGKATHAVRRTQ